MPLSRSDKKHFRTRGHHLKPVLQLGDKGFTDAVSDELDKRLEDHELIKIKLHTSRDERRQRVDTICERLEAEEVQLIGDTLLLYRAAVKPDPHLSNLLRHQ